MEVVKDTCAELFQRTGASRDVESTQAAQSKEKKTESSPQVNLKPATEGV